MWSKLTLRIKLTILTALALSLLTACITGISIYNARRNFVIPLENFNFGAENRENGVSNHHFVNEPVGTLETEDRNVAFRFLVNRSQSDFQTQSIIIAAVFIAFGTFGAFVISGRTLKPIKTLAEKIEDIDENSLSEQLESPKSNDEVSRLTHSFNQLLLKLNRSFENQRLFAQNAAHELKTPLSSIMANIEVLELDDEPTVNEYKELIDDVKVSTERLIELVKGLLSLNSILDESQFQPFDARVVIEPVLGELQGLITQKGVGVIISGQCRIKGDKALLERAFFNLIHNAVRYNNDNGDVKIILASDSIIIEDNGLGIPADSLEQIFEPFYCVDKSRSKKLGGHGLGMTIAKNIFDKHEIEVCIFSEVGEGTKIILKPQII
jgi:signal transduction histidine kinase